MASLTKKDLNDAIDTIIGEAVGGGAEGMETVAWVIANRARQSGKSISEVVRQRSQFEGFTNPGAKAKAHRGEQKYRDIAAAAITRAVENSSPDPTNGADHMLKDGVTTDWSRKMFKTTSVGGNTFFRSKKALVGKSTPIPIVRQKSAIKIGNSSHIGGKFTVNGKAKSRGVKNIDNRLLSVLEKAASNSPYDVEVFSGKRFGGRGSQHDKGTAVDIVLRDPKTGDKIPNYMAGGKAFEIYENFAKEARAVQEADHPELSKSFRWGGYFGSSGLNYGGADLMHFDLKPGAPMSRGSWEGGLNAAGKKAIAKLGSGKTYSSTGIVAGRMPSNAPIPAARLARTDGKDAVTAIASLDVDKSDGESDRAIGYASTMAHKGEPARHQGSQALIHPRPKQEMRSKPVRQPGRGYSEPQVISRKVAIKDIDPTTTAGNVVMAGRPASIAEKKFDAIKRPERQPGRGFDPAKRSALMDSVGGPVEFGDIAEMMAPEGGAKKAVETAAIHKKRVGVAKKAAKKRVAASNLVKQVAKQRKAQSASYRKPKVVRRKVNYINPNYHNSRALAAIKSGKSSYVNSNGSVMPTKAPNGNYRYTYGD